MIEAYSSETNVYEHGIAVEGDEHMGSLGLIATAKQPIYSGFSLSIVDFEGYSLNKRAVHLANVKGSHSLADYYEEGDLRYCVLATLYHLNRLIDLYVRLTRLFERMHPLGTTIRGNMSDPRVFYEIDAFLGAARRVYESMKDVLWKHYHPGVTGKWGMTIKLPANPHEQSRKAFDFDSGPEALSYCHSVACHLVELCESMETQTKVASYLTNPRMG